MSHRKPYTVNGLNERGASVAQGFAYSSGDNDDFLTVEQLVRLNKQLLA